MTNKPEEQTRESRELTAQELEVVAGGWAPGGMAMAYGYARRQYQTKCGNDPMACQY